MLDAKIATSIHHSVSHSSVMKKNLDKPSAAHPEATKKLVRKIVGRIIRRRRPSSDRGNAPLIAAVKSPLEPHNSATSAQPAVMSQPALQPVQVPQPSGKPAIADERIGAPATSEQASNCNSSRDPKSGPGKSKPNTRSRKARQDASRPINLNGTGFLRLDEVLTVIPVSRASWYEGIRKLLYPAPVRLSPNRVGWRVEDIRKLCADLSANAITFPKGNPSYTGAT